MCQRIARLGLLLLAATAVPAAGAGTEDDAAAAARSLQARLQAITTVEARFVQTLDSLALPAPQIEEGRVWLQRPGRMRWEYTTPPGKLAIADGASSWLYLPEDRQVLRSPLADAGRDPGMGLLWRDRIDLLRDFRVDWEAAARPRTRRLRLRPRGADAAFDALLVEVDGGGFPAAITILDPLGGRIAYRFEAIRLGAPLDPALFTFTPPAGLTVQEVAP